MIQKQSSVKEAILITGASTGIGEACAIYLDKLGYQVFAGVRNKMDGDALRQKASKRLIPIFLDVTEETSIRTAVKTITEILGTANLVGLVNNAGIAIAGAVELLPIAELRKQLEVNVIGQIAVTQAFLPMLRKTQGRIINISSESGKISFPFLGAYCASKFALEALTDALRIELQAWGIQVVLIEPGVIATPIWEKSLAKADEIWNQSSSEVHHLYSSARDAIQNKTNQITKNGGKNGLPAEVVAKTVTKALTTKKPKTRYVIGLDAKLGIGLAKIIPDRLFDKFISRYLGLPKLKT